jgi:hypothetical protein
MDLKMRQALVQSCGTITAFNYAYCKTIYDKAVELLNTDFINRNGQVLPLEKKSFIIFEQKFAESDKATSVYEGITDPTDEDFNRFKTICNASCIVLKNSSLLPILINHLGEQLNYDSHISFSDSGYSKPEDFRALTNEVLNYLKMVKEFLAMFE